MAVTPGVRVVSATRTSSFASRTCRSGPYSGGMDRDEICERFLDAVPFSLYPFQEDALLTWFECEHGVLVTAPTGMGKTLIAESAVFEALHTGKRLYYTTPLIALTDQKFREFQEKAEEWGFHPDDVGLITGNRRVNGDAPVVVVVAEILLNHLLSDRERFVDVGSVVMDEFHYFNDRERGIVWELSLVFLPKNVRLMLLSATVGNPIEFIHWLRDKHGRDLRLCRTDERKVPLEFQWVDQQLLSEFLPEMNKDDDALCRTPALVFCFMRGRVLGGGGALEGAAADPQGDARRDRGGAGRPRPLAGGRPEAAADADPRRRRPSRRHPAALQGAGGGALPAQAGPVRGLHRDPRRRHQPPRPLGRAVDAAARAEDQEEGDPRVVGPPDVRPRRPSAVRQAGLRLRDGTRRRRQDQQVEGEVRPARSEVEGPGNPPRAQASRAQATLPSLDGDLLDRRPVREPDQGGIGQAAKQLDDPVPGADLPADPVAGPASGPPVPGRTLRLGGPPGAFLRSARSHDRQPRVTEVRQAGERRRGGGRRADRRPDGLPIGRSDVRSLARAYAAQRRPPGEGRGVGVRARRGRRGSSTRRGSPTSSRGPCRRRCWSR